VLRLNNGERVAEAAAWRDVRRPQIVRAFEDENYGHVPEVVPAVTCNYGDSLRIRIFDPTRSVWSLMTNNS
jgi:hypothetical protein